MTICSWCKLICLNLVTFLKWKLVCKDTKITIHRAFNFFYFYVKSLTLMYEAKQHDLTITWQLSPPTKTWNQNIPALQSAGRVVKHVLAGNKGNVIIVGDYFHPQAYIDYFSVIASVELLSAFHLACYHPSKSGGRILRSIPSRINSGRKLVLEKHNQIGVLLMKCPLSYNNIVGMIWF